MRLPITGFLSNTTSRCFQSPPDGTPIGKNGRFQRKQKRIIPGKVPMELQNQGSLCIDDGTCKCVMSQLVPCFSSQSCPTSTGSHSVSVSGASPSAHGQQYHRSV